ncbi:MAG: ComF family protein [Candidatus Bipolaricaulia bacterium]
MGTRVRHLVQTAAQSTLDLVYPPDCPVCEAALNRDTNQSARFVCANCRGNIERFEPPWCEACGLPVPEGIDLCARCGQMPLPIAKARAVGPYDGPLARLIQLYKFHGERALAADLGRLLAERVLDEAMDTEVDAITYVPMTRRARRERGFNHVERLARQLGTHINRPVVPALEKTRETRPQVELPERERLDNLRGALAPTQPLPWEGMLLVDDVFTTGSTIRECSQTLVDAGVERVLVATLARTAEEA